MGYCISQIGSEFFMAADQQSAALEACKVLAGHADQGTGSSYSNGRTTARWFSWLNGTPFDTSWNGPFRSSMNEVFDDWRYKATFNEDGDIIRIDFTGEKIGDEIEFFKAIAPYVKPGSYLEMSGEDGARWRWYFDGVTCEEQAAKITY